MRDESLNILSLSASETKLDIHLQCSAVQCSAAQQVVSSLLFVTSDK